MLRRRSTGCASPSHEDRRDGAGSRALLSPLIAAADEGREVFRRERLATSASAIPSLRFFEAELPPSSAIGQRS